MIETSKSNVGAGTVLADSDLNVFDSLPRLVRDRLNYANYNYSECQIADLLAGTSPYTIDQINPEVVSIVKGFI